MADGAVRGLPIALDGVGVRRGAAQLLRDVHLVVAPRERTIVLGPNGAGKSTLLRVMALIAWLRMRLSVPVLMISISLSVASGSLRFARMLMICERIL